MSIDLKIGVAKRHMADRRVLWRLGLYSRLGVGFAAIVLAVISLG